MGQKVYQQIALCGKDVEQHPNYDQNELEDLLTALISKTSYREVSFRNEVRSFTESSVPAKETNITIGRDMASSCITVRMQMKGYSEKWMAHVYLKKHVQRDADAFFEDMKLAARTIYLEEIKKQLGKQEVPKLPAPKVEKPDVVTKQEAPPPPTPKAEDTDIVPADHASTVASDNVATAPQREIKRRKKTAAFITMEVVLKILESWMKFSGDGGRIHQAELWSIIAKLELAPNRLSILRFLRKKGFVEVVHIEQQRPQVKITQLGLDLLGGQRQQTAAEDLKTRKREHFQKIIDYPKLTLSQLEILLSLQVVYNQLEKTVAEKATGIKLIADLQAEISQWKEELIKLETEEQKHLKEIRRLLSLIDSDKLVGLIELGEKSVRQKTEPQ